MTRSSHPIEFRPHSAHWGAFSAGWQGDRLVVRPHPGDPDPSPTLQNFPDALRHRARVARPMVRRGWLERGPGPDDRRGRDGFVPMAWDRVLDLLAAELKRVTAAHGPRAVFGGSYGWSSAGRFHHAVSQIHRFLNVALGGDLVQHLPNRTGSDAHLPRPGTFGPVLVNTEPGSHVRRLCGDRVEVSCHHHQAVGRLGRGLRVTAHSQDGVVEAVELEGHAFVVGVQWHPEEPGDVRLFEGLVEASRRPPGRAVAAGTAA